MFVTDYYMLMGGDDRSDYTLSTTFQNTSFEIGGGVLTTDKYTPPPRCNSELLLHRLAGVVGVVKEGFLPRLLLIRRLYNEDLYL